VLLGRTYAPVENIPAVINRAFRSRQLVLDGGWGQHLDRARGAVDPDAVARVQHRGGVAAADDGRDAKLATVVTRISPASRWSPSSALCNIRTVPSTTPFPPGKESEANRGRQR
jgi:hypothetical protein